MNVAENQDLIERQSKAIAILSLRITTLEQILLEKGHITESDVANKATQLGKEFVVQTKEAFKKAAEDQRNVE